MYNTDPKRHPTLREREGVRESKTGRTKAKVKLRIAQTNTNIKDIVPRDMYIIPNSSSGLWNLNLIKNISKHCFSSSLLIVVFG